MHEQTEYISSAPARLRTHRKSAGQTNPSEEAAGFGYGESAPDETIIEDEETEGKAQTGNVSTPYHGIFATKKFAGLSGSVLGLAAFGLVYYATPALIQSATYAVAQALIVIFAPSAALYMGALVAVALATALIGALLALAVKSIVDHCRQTQVEST